MKTFFTKKIAATLLVILVAAPLALFALPQKVHAQEAVIDAGNIVQTTVTAANTTVSSYSNMSLQLKAFVLDTLATTLVKQLIRSITASVVNWINSGFEGSPSFLENPGSFFLDVADQITGAFLAQSGGPLNQLCSAFSIDIRLQLSFKYHPKIHQKYACTLSTIIANSRNAVNNATINGQSISGFVNGDFKQGGLPAFVSLTTEPQNNPYGAYLEADSEIGIRVANAQNNKKEELGAGKGFLSWRDRSCTQDAKRYQQATRTAQADPGGESPNGAEARQYLNDVQFAQETGGSPPATSEQDCPIRTPGSVIVSSLETSVNGPMHELGLVDSINEIVGALAAQLVNTVLQGGLKAISGAGPSDTTSYLYAVQAEANASAGPTSIQSNLTSQIDTYIIRTREYKNNRDQALEAVASIKNIYLAAKTCYSRAISEGHLTSSQVSFANSRISYIDNFVATNISPTYGRLENEAGRAQGRLDTLVELRDEAGAATNASQLNGPSERFSQMLQNQNLTSPLEVINSSEDLQTARQTASNLRPAAERELASCRTFPASMNSTSFIP